MGPRVQVEGHASKRNLEGVGEPICPAQWFIGPSGTLSLKEDPNKHLEKSSILKLFSKFQEF